MATRTRKTGPKAASAAAKVLADSRSTKREKSAAASALAQVEGALPPRQDHAESIVRLFLQHQRDMPTSWAKHARPFEDLARLMLRTLPSGRARVEVLLLILQAQHVAFLGLVESELEARTPVA